MRVLLLAAVGAAGVALLFAVPASTPSIRDENGARVRGSIAAVDPLT